MNKLDELLNLPRYLAVSSFEEYINAFLDRKADKALALQELDDTIAMLQSHILSLALLVKQNHLARRKDRSIADSDIEFYTKQELAVKYRVSVRTVTNWIIDGLDVEEIGGVKRISNTALKKFIKTRKGKKFNWKSIAR